MMRRCRTSTSTNSSSGRHGIALGWRHDPRCLAIYHGFYGAIPDLVVSEGIEVTGLTSTDDRLQAVFDYLVK